MNKPNNYEATKVGGNYIPPQVGGHHMVIKQVAETKTKDTNKDMIVVCYDFDKNDVQPGLFTNEFKNDIRPEKKWPYAGTAYIVCEDNDGNCSKKLKSFITCFEKSNNCEAVWGEKFAGQFKNKKIGGVFGEVESEWNGKRTMRHELRWFCETSNVDGATVPDPKYLPKPQEQKPDADGFLQAEDGDIPWA